MEIPVYGFLYVMHLVLPLAALVVLRRRGGPAPKFAAPAPAVLLPLALAFCAALMAASGAAASSSAWHGWRPVSSRRGCCGGTRSRIPPGTPRPRAPEQPPVQADPPTVTQSLEDRGAGARGARFPPPRRPAAGKFPRRSAVRGGTAVIAAPEDSERARPVALALGGFIALAAAMGIGRFVYTPILPRMAEALGMTKGAAGLLASANFAGYLAGALAAATPAFGGARRDWLLAGLAGSAVTTGAMAFVSSAAAFAVLRFAGEVASAFVLVFASALVLDRLRAAGRPDLSAVYFAGVGMGIAVSAALVGVIAAWGGGWRALWLASGLVSLLALAGVARLIPGQREVPRAAAPPAQRRTRRLAAFAAAYGLFGFGYVITATFLVTIVRGSHALRPLETLVWIVVGVAAAPSVAFWTALGRRIGIAPAFALACVTQAAGVVASVLWLTPAGAFLAAVFLGGTMLGLTALGLIGGQRLSAGDPRRALAILTAVFGAGQIAGPAFAGAVYDATGSFVLPSLAAAGALLLGAVLAVAG